MAKKTSTTTRKSRATRSSGGASTTKGNSSGSSRRATTKGGQSNNYDYDDDSYSSGSTIDNDYNSGGNTTSNIKPVSGNAGGHGGGSTTKDDASYNDNYNSGDSFDSGYSKDNGGYSDSYNDNESLTKGDSSYNDVTNNNRESNAYETSKNSGNNSDDGYENGTATKEGYSYDDNYSNEDYYNSGSGKNTGGYSYNEPINDPPPFEDYDDEVVAKTPNSGGSRGSSGTSKFGNNEGEADMTFTEEEVYTDEVVAKTPNTVESNSNTKYSNIDGEADMTFTEEEAFGDDNGTREDSEDQERFEGPLARITPSQIRRVKQRLHIPENGFVVTARGGRTVRKNVEVERMNQLLERLENREIARHVEDTINLFVNESDRRSHLNRNQIDIALILAIAIRESGVALTVSRRNNRIVSAGRDAHSQGRSGLDWIYSKKRSFPAAIRSQVRPVRDNPDVGGEFRRPNVTPAFLRERDLLAAFVVEVNVRNDRFLRFFNERVFNSDFNDEQRTMLLHNLNHDAKRSWIQAAFGSKLMQLLQAVKGLIQEAIASGASFSDIAADDMINLNAIVTNDGIMTDNLSRQRTRISAAEAILMEEALGSRF